MKACVNIWNEPIVCSTRLKRRTGESIGSVMVKNCLTFDAPSTEDASYSSDGICFNPARKITIDEPNCHATRIINVPRAVPGLLIQLIPSTPKMLKNLLMKPSIPKMFFHRTATAILLPMREGR
ncbi:hypothetical protein D3C86_1791690 [compost metagenome]